MNKFHLTIGFLFISLAFIQSFKIQADETPAINNAIKKSDSRTDRGAALAMAFAAIPDEPDTIGIGAGRFVATSAGAIGATIAMDHDRTTMVKLMAGTSTHRGADKRKHDKAGAVGFAYKFR